MREAKVDQETIAPMDDIVKRSVALLEKKLQHEVRDPHSVAEEIAQLARSVAIQVLGELYGRKET